MRPTAPGPGHLCTTITDGIAADRSAEPTLRVGFDGTAPNRALTYITGTIHNPDGSTSSTFNPLATEPEVPGRVVMVAVCRLAIIAAIALAGLTSCRTDHEGQTAVETATEGTDATAEPPDTSTTTSPDLDEVRAWAGPFCQSSLDLLLAWHELDDESDWLVIASDLDETMQRYAHAIGAMPTPPFDMRSWEEFVATVEEQSALIGLARDEVRAMDPADFEDGTSYHQADEVMEVTFLALGEFLQHVGAASRGPDGNPGANYSPACDELAQVYFFGASE